MRGIKEGDGSMSPAGKRRRGNSARLHSLRRNGGWNCPFSLVAISRRDQSLMLVVLTGGLGESLCFLQRRINRFIASDYFCKLLRNLIAELLEFGDVDVLDADVRNRVDRRVRQ